MSDIARAVSDGTYRVDALAIADAVLRRWARYDLLDPESDYEVSTTSDEDSRR